MKKLLSFCLFTFMLGNSALFAQKDTTILYAGKDTTISMCPQGCKNLLATVKPSTNSVDYKIDTITYAPDSYNAGTLVSFANSNTVSTAKPIGFTFCFFGEPYTDFYIGSNGWIGFSPNQTAYPTSMFSTPPPLPNADSTKTPRNAIFWLWTNLSIYASPGVNVYYQTYGTAPNRKMVVSFYNTAPHCLTAHSGPFLSGQIIIYETTNVIELFTDTLSTLCKPGIPREISVQGLLNKTGTKAVVDPNRNSKNWAVSNDGIRFTPIGTVAPYTLNWFKTDTSSSNKLFTDTDTSKSHQVCPTVTTDYIAQVIRNGCPVDTFYDTINVKVTGGAFPATAAVVSQPTCGQANGSVRVTVTGGTPNYDYVWKDATGKVVSTVTGSSATTNTVNNLSAGTYYITATESQGCVANDSVTLVSTNAPTSTFTAKSPVCVNANDTITYTGNGGAGAAYTWGFSGGTVVSGSGKGPYVVNWTTAGTKNITLTVTENGCPSGQTTVPVTVNAIPTSPFTATTACVNANSTITYTGSASSSATYTWNFNGGTIASGTGQGPHSVNWGTAGTKNITLTVTENGCTSPTTTIPVTINAIPTSTFTRTTPVCEKANSTITYTGTGGNNATYTWGFSGGTVASGTGKGPYSVNWATAGTKNITLTVTENGCTSPVTDSTVIVNAIPSSAFTVTSPVCVNVNSAITYTGGAGNTATYTWNFNGGTTASGTGKGPYQIKWTTSGTKNITLTVVENGCTSPVTTVPVTVNPKPDTTFTVVSPVCVGQNSTVIYTGSTANPTCTWDFNGGNIISGSGKGPYQISWQNSGNKNVKLKVTDSNSCSDSAQKTVVVSATLIIPIAPANPVICKGDSITLTASGATSYLWAGSNATTASITVKPTADSTFSVSGSNSVCSGGGSILVKVNELPVANMGKDTGVCIGSSVVLNSGGNTSYKYTWLVTYGLNSDTVPSPVANPDSTTTYIVSITDTNNCSDTDTIVVKINPNPFVNAGPDVTITSEDSAKLSAITKSQGTFLWTPEGGLNCPACQTTGAKPERTTQYYVTLVDTNGCVAFDSVKVFRTCGDLFIPNAFTPNTDEKNDGFSVYHEGFKRLDMHIFDRWGEEVYQTDSFDKPWDGKKDNLDAKEDVYVYVIFAWDCFEQRHKYVGKVSLIR